MSETKRNNKEDKSKIYMLICLQVNLNNGLNISNQLNNYLNDKKDIDVISICEPHTNKVNYKASNLFNNYNIISYSVDNLRSRAAVLVKKGIRFSTDEELSNRFFVIVHLDKLVVISCYLEPSIISIDKKRSEKPIGPDLDYLQQILNKYKNQPTIILTDSNAKHLVWGNKETSDRGELMYDLILMNNLTLLNDKSLGPTFKKRVQEQNSIIRSTRSSYIDLSLINDKVKRDCKWSLLENIIDTEHLTIEIKIKASKTTIQHVKKINYKRTNWKRFIETFNEERPKSFTDNDPNLVIEKFEEALKKADVHISYKSLRVSNSIPYFKEEINLLNNEILRIRRSLTTFDKINQKFLKLKLRLKELNKDFYSKVKEAKIEFYKRLNNVHSTQDLWLLWKKTKSSSNSDHLPLFRNCKNLIENNREIARHFIRNTENPYKVLQLRSNFVIQQTNKDELMKIVNEMSNKKAPGPDQIPNKLMKILIVNCNEFFVELYNYLLKIKKIPDKWKVGKMIYFCKPNRVVNSPSDLRPITLINGWCKICEALFASRVEDELNRTNFFSDRQFGFRRNVSTVNAISEVIKHIKQSKKSNYAVAIALDASAAFDTLNWNMIINNLIKHNCDNSIIKLVQSMLINRRVVLNDIMYQSSVGCPQGARCSPLLWRIGLNKLLIDLGEIENLKVTAFADDLLLIVKSNNEEDLLNQLRKTMIIVNRWCRSAEIKLNASKTEIISIGKRKIEEIKINDIPIQSKNKLKYLGIVIDNKLLFKDHLIHIKSKTEKLMLRIKNVCWLNRDIELSYKMNLYNNVFIPTMSYGLSVWYDTVFSKSTYKEDLVKLQRSIIRAITGAYKNANIDKLLEITDSLKITDELEILNLANSQPKNARKDFKMKSREEIIKNRRKFIELDYINFNQIKNKETIWCLTEAGPFRNFLLKINAPFITENTCRFCYLEIETAEHLLFYCNNLKHNNFNNCSELENEIKILFKELERVSERN